MFVSEAEAMNLLCPATFNTSVAKPGDPWLKCVASKCMAWRWGYKIVNGHNMRIDKGYCGLVGVPYAKIS